MRIIVIGLVSISLSTPSLAVDLAIPDLPPWSIQATDGATRGILVDSAREISRLGGNLFSVSSLPAKRLLSALQSGESEAAIFPSDPDIDRYATRIGVIVEVPTVVCASKGVNLANIEAVRELKIVGVPFGLNLRGLTDDPTIHTSPEKDVPQEVRKLAAGRLDAVSGSAAAVHQAAHDLNLDDAIGSCLAIGKIEFYLYASNNTKKITQDKILETYNYFEKSGSFSAIKGKYVAEDWRPIK